MIHQFLHPRLHCLSALFLLLQTSGFPQTNAANTLPLVYSDEQMLQPLSGYLYILEDAAGTCQPGQMLTRPGFRLSSEAVPNLSISNSAFWIKFQVQNQSQSEQLLLKLAQPNIDNVVFYHLLTDGTWAAEKTGLMYPYRPRAHDSQHFIFDIRLRKGETGTYLLRLQTGGQLQVPLWIGSQQGVYKSVSREDLYMGLYVGIIIAMFLYNLFLLVTIRSRSYCLYVLNILMVGLTQVTFQGYAYRFFWPHLPWVAAVSYVATIPGPSTGRSTNQFLNLGFQHKGQRLMNGVAEHAA